MIKERNSMLGGASIALPMLVIAIVWGLSFLGSNIALKQMNTLQILATRWTVSMALFLAIMAAGKIRVNLRKGKLGLLLLTGFLQPCIYSIFETAGVRMTSTSECAIFIALIPSATLLIGALFFHRGWNKNILAGIVLAFLGVCFCTVFTPGFSLSGKWLGYLVLMGAVVTSGFYSQCSGTVGQYYDPLELTAVMSIMAAIFFNGLCLMQGDLLEGYRIVITDHGMMGAILFLGIGCSCVCYIMFNYMLGRINPAVATNLSASCSTSVGLLSGILIAGDPGGWYTAVGLGLTLVGLYVTSKQV